MYRLCFEGDCTFTLPIVCLCVHRWCGANVSQAVGGIGCALFHACVKQQRKSG